MQELKNRIDIAVELMTEADSMPVGDILLSAKKNLITVTGASGCFLFENVTRINALDDIDWIKKTFGEMLDISSSLRDFMVGKEISYQLIFDYKISGRLLCSEVNNTITWYEDIQ